MCDFPEMWKGLQPSQLSPLGYAPNLTTLYLYHRKSYSSHIAHYFSINNLSNLNSHFIKY